MQVEVQHADGSGVVPGYHLQECNVVVTDGVNLAVSWMGNRTTLPTELLGARVVLVLELAGPAVMHSYSVGGCSAPLISISFSL